MLFYHKTILFFQVIFRNINYLLIYRTVQVSATFRFASVNDDIFLTLFD